MSNLREKYNTELKAVLQEKLGIKNLMAVPKLTKVVINMGVGEAAIALSNLAIWNPSKKSKDKISYSTNKDGKKIRLFKSDSKEIK